jgi:hypothetical protein
LTIEDLAETDQGEKEAKERKRATRRGEHSNGRRKDFRKEGATRKESKNGKKKKDKRNEADPS